MGVSKMKSEMHGKLWGAMQRWFDLKDQGATKHALKMEGIRERGDMFYATRGVIFTGSTRLAYERELKGFIDYVHRERGKTQNYDVDRKDFRAYMEHRMERGGAASELNKVRSAIVKFGALYGKYESFHAMSQKLGTKIREMKASGQLAPPARPHVTPKVREAVIARLGTLDGRAEARTGEPRAYGLAVALQKEGSLRAIEATDRMTPGCLKGLRGDRGLLAVTGKGGKVREVWVSKDLYVKLQAHFARNGGKPLAPRRSYQQALRRATLAAGGQATGSHAHRRLSAEELKNAKYWEHLRNGNVPKKARDMAVKDTVEHLGHSRCRKDLAKAYLARRA